MERYLLLLLQKSHNYLLVNNFLPAIAKFVVAEKNQGKNLDEEKAFILNYSKKLASIFTEMLNNDKLTLEQFENYFDDFIKNNNPNNETIKLADKDDKNQLWDIINACKTKISNINDTSEAMSAINDMEEKWNLPANALIRLFFLHCHQNEVDKQQIDFNWEEYADKLITAQLVNIPQYHFLKMQQFSAQLQVAENEKAEIDDLKQPAESDKLQTQIVGLKLKIEQIKAIMTKTNNIDLLNYQIGCVWQLKYGSPLVELLLTIGPINDYLYFKYKIDDKITINDFVSNYLENFDFSKDNIDDYHSLRLFTFSCLNSKVMIPVQQLNDILILNQIIFEEINNDKWNEHLQFIKNNIVNNIDSIMNNTNISAGKKDKLIIKVFNQAANNWKLLKLLSPNDIINSKLTLFKAELKNLKINIKNGQLKEERTNLLPHFNRRILFQIIDQAFKSKNYNIGKTWLYEKFIIDEKELFFTTESELERWLFFSLCDQKNYNQEEIAANNNFLIQQFYHSRSWQLHEFYDNKESKNKVLNILAEWFMKTKNIITNNSNFLISSLLTTIKNEEALILRDKIIKNIPLTNIGEYNTEAQLIFALQTMTNFQQKNYLAVLPLINQLLLMVNRELVKLPILPILPNY